MQVNRADVLSTVHPRVGYRPSLIVTYTTSATVPVPTLRNFNATLIGGCRQVWVDAATGNDTWGSGHPAKPFKSPAKAMWEAYPCDTIMLRSGVYPGAGDSCKWRRSREMQPRLHCHGCSSACVMLANGHKSLARIAPCCNCRPPKNAELHT